MKLPDDQHLKSLFIKTYREIARFTDDDAQRIKIHEALLEYCLSLLESNFHYRDFESSRSMVEIMQEAGIRRFLVFNITPMEELLSAIKAFNRHPGVIASFYELQPELKHKKKVKSEALYGESHSERKRAGCFYTPLGIADFIARTAIDFYLKSNRTKNREITILDPSVGAGIFLDVAINNLTKRKKFKDGENLHIFGIDRDSEALKLAERILKIKKRDNIHIKTKLTEGDFLLDNLTHPEKGYDIIIGNPPYISYYSREAHSDNDIKRLLKEQYRTKSGGSLNTFLHFIVHGIELLSDGGVLGYIIPDKLLWNRRYHPTRSFILDHAKPIAIFTAGEGIFEGVNVGNAIIILQKKDTLKQCQLADLIFDRQKKEIEIQNIRVVEPTGFLKIPEFRFTIANPLVSKIEKNSVPFDELAYIKDGINPAFREFREKIISSSKIDMHYRQLIEGEDIHPFQIVKRPLFINYDCSLITPELRKRGASFREAWIFNSPRKLVNRQTADKLIFALDENKLCDLNSVHNTILREGVDGRILVFLLGLMNSRLMNYYYQEVSHETAKSFPQVHIAELRSLPIKIPQSNEMDKFVKIINQIRNSKTNRSKLIGLLDEAIFELYGINEKAKKTIIKAT